jgi:hypothetical protein
MRPSRLVRRVTMLFTRRRFERDLADEMQLHVELREARARSRGACQGPDRSIVTPTARTRPLRPPYS